MDFFATGGFQQLFSDLEADGTAVSPPQTDFREFHTHADDDTYECELDFTDIVEVFGDRCQNINEFVANYVGERRGSVDEGNGNVDFCLADNETFYSYQTLATISANAEVGNNPFVGNHHNHSLQKDYNNNTNETVTTTSLYELSNKQLEASLDFLLHSEDIVGNLTDPDIDADTCIDPKADLDAATFISQQMDEWEEKFLDNYVELPDLIDCLPEKTPLCTEVCELFLQESSKNLRLSPKARLKSSTDPQSDKCYPCTFGDCQKLYAKPAHLKAHLRRHLGEKPYICNWPDCTWKFSRSDELARHRRSHSGVKPYKCNYCSKCFARSDHLTKHRKVHERRLLAASKAGKTLNGELPHCVLTVRPGRKRKNQIF